MGRTLIHALKYKNSTFIHFVKEWGNKIYILENMGENTVFLNLFKKDVSHTRSFKESNW